MKDEKEFACGRAQLRLILSIDISAFEPEGGAVEAHFDKGVLHRGASRAQKGPAHNLISEDAVTEIMLTSALLRILTLGDILPIGDNTVSIVRNANHPEGYALMCGKSSS